MRLSKLIFSIFLISSLQASSLLKVVCDRDDENIYLDGKFKTECSYNEVVKLLVSPGKHTIKIIKNNPDKSYYVFKDSIRLGDGIEKVIEVNSKIVYTKDYYYKRAYKSLKDAKIFISKYPNSNEAIKVKNYWENRYWKNCNTLNGCKDYLSEIPWKKHTQQAKSKLEKYYYQKAKNDISYAWKYLKKYPNGKYVRNIKTLLDNYYYKRCNNIDSCEVYLNKITWDKNREKKVKSKLEKLYKNYALNYHKYDIYLNKYPNGKYKNEVLEEKLYYLAKTKKDKDSFLAYLNKFPNGKYAKKVKFWLDNVLVLDKIIYNKNILIKSENVKIFTLNNKTFIYEVDYKKVRLVYLENNIVKWVINDLPYYSVYRIDINVLDDKVFLSQSGHLFCIDIKNNKILWHISFASRDNWNEIYKIKIYNNELYVAHTANFWKNPYYPNPAIAKIDINTGKILYDIVLNNFKIYSTNYNSIDFDIDNHLMIIGASGDFYGSKFHLIKFNDNGDIIWKKLLGSSYYRHKAYLFKSSDGNFITNTANSVVKFDKNGNIIWKTPIKNFTIKLKNNIILGMSVKKGIVRLFKIEENGNIFWSYQWKVSFDDLKDIGFNKDNVLLIGIQKPGYVYKPFLAIFKPYKATK